MERRGKQASKRSSPCQIVSRVFQWKGRWQRLPIIRINSSLAKWCLVWCLFSLLCVQMWFWHVGPLRFGKRLTQRILRSFGWRNNFNGCFSGKRCDTDESSQPALGYTAAAQFRQACRCLFIKMAASRNPQRSPFFCCLTKFKRVE